MYKKYIFPIQIFLILEKMNLIFWNSKTITPNAYICFINHKWFYTLNILFKNELFLNNSFLIENTAIDNRYLKHLNYTNCKTLNVYLYYFFDLKLKIILLINMHENYSNKTYLNSIDKIFCNANWLERETSEMYGILYYFKYDIRKLLLDYSKIENPLLKDFSSEGLQDIFYNFFENQVTVNKNEIIEL